METLPRKIADFREVVFVDFEYRQADGEVPRPWCMVAHELNSGRKYRMWYDEFAQGPPFPVDDEHTLFVAYAANAEIACLRVLGWPLPPYVLCLFTEFRNHTNGFTLAHGDGLSGAARYFGQPLVDEVEKATSRDLAIRGAPFDVEERERLLRYCESDVDATARVFDALLPCVDISLALIRGAFLSAVAEMENTGLPVDRPMYDRLCEAWPDVLDHLIADVNKVCPVYDGQSFRQRRWLDWCGEVGINWPLSPTGAPKLTKDTFKALRHLHPAVAHVYQVRRTLSTSRFTDLAVGNDDRNRSSLQPFRTKTGRCAPSTTRYIFGLAKWIRHLLKPPPGWALAVLDWVAAEIGTSAEQSGDANLRATYHAAEPYCYFGWLAGAVPESATKQSHPVERALYKQTLLSVGYGIGEISLGHSLGKPPIYARELLHKHRQVYSRYWQWSDSMVDYAVLAGSLRTPFGWQYHTPVEPNPRSLMNWPVQATACEALRLACVFAQQDGVRLCGCVHDSIIIEAPSAEIDDAVHVTTDAMDRASTLVLGGVPLRSDVQIVRYPDRYHEPDGAEMWGKVQQLIT